MSLELKPGTVIAERYRLKRLIGQGGMGSVWAASHTLTRKPVALKFLTVTAADHPTAVRRFIREARAASAVRHRNVVQVHDILELDEGQPAMVMDLLDGESLRQRFERDHTLSLAEIAAILMPVISAVGAAHETGIVHRDLKPENIFLEKDASGRVEPKVLDFGVAKLTAADGDAAATVALTQTGALVGTPYYMAPEQAFGEKDVDYRADVWALGVILYEALAGNRPIPGDNLGRIYKALSTGEMVPLGEAVPGLPADVVALAGRMLELDRDQRIGDLSEPFEVLARHTDVRAPAFGRPASSRSSDRPDGPTALPLNTPTAHAATVAAGGGAATPSLGSSGASAAPADASSGASGSSPASSGAAQIDTETGLAGSRVGKPSRSRSPLVALAAAGIAVLGFVGIWRLTSDDETAAQAGTTAPQEAPSTPSGSSDPATDSQPGASATSAAPSPSSTADEEDGPPSASASSVPPPSVGSTARPVAAMPVRPTKPPEEAPPAASGKSPPPEKPVTGKIVPDVPF